METEVPKVFYSKELENANISKYFKRGNFIDPEERKKIKQTYQKNKPLAFYPSGVEENFFKDELIAFGVLTNGAKAKVIIDGCIPSFLVYGCETTKDLLSSRQAIIDCIDKCSHVSKKKDVNKFQYVEPGEPLENKYGYPSSFMYTVEEVRAKDFRGYKTNDQVFFKIITSCGWYRKILIGHLEKNGFKLFSNDDKMIRKLSRETKKLFCNWLILKNYRISTPLNNQKNIYDFNHCNYVIKVNLEDVKSINEDDPDVNEFKKSKKITVDKSLVLSFDIETISHREGDHLPISKYEEDIVFMICLTLHWADESDTFMRICISDKEISPHEDWYTIVCDSEKDVILTFGKIWNRFKPEIQIGFNDSQYDWPFIMGKIIQYDILHEMLTMMSCMPLTNKIEKSMVIKHNWIETKLNIMDSRITDYWPLNSSIKIDSELSHDITFLKIPGSVHLDVRPCFMKIYPIKGSEATSSKLKEFLRVCKLDNKEPLAIHDMWDIYREGDPDKMIDVAKYCVIDAKRCQDLMVVKNVYNDYREIAALAYVSFHEVYLYANGSRVLNLVASLAHERGYVMNMKSNRTSDGCKFKGAFVFNPEKGLVPCPNAIAAFEKDAESFRECEDMDLLIAMCEALRSHRPVSGLDFASLYPSIIMAYNFSPEKLLLGLQAYEKYKDKVKLHKITGSSGHDITAWTVWHENDEEQMGLFPTILCDLKKKRKLMKLDKALYEDKKEQMDVVLSKVTKTNTDKVSILEEVLNNCEKSIESCTDEKKLKYFKSNKKILEELSASVKDNDSFDDIYGDCVFSLKYCDSKQKALKVYMNTFYGVTGQTVSPLFQLEIAAGITSAGRYNIHMIEQFVKEKGFHIKYGDTDSLYLSAPPKAFLECDMEYAKQLISKEEWYRKMVEITMKEIDKLKVDVNKRLKEDNKTDYLKMEYEEVLYPVLFAGKKKYCGIPHMSEIIFDTSRERLFIKGMDLIRSDQTDFSINTMYKTVQTILHIDNKKVVMDIVHDTIEESIKTISSHNIDDFVLTCKWKPPLKKCEHPSCNVNACYKVDEKMFCQLHATKKCEKCDNRASYITADNCLLCGVHKKDEHKKMDPDDSFLYLGKYYTQYDRELWVPGKGTASTLNYVSRMYDDFKKKTIRNNKLIEKNGGSSEGITLEKVEKMPLINEDMKYVVSAKNSAFHLNGNRCDDSVGTKMTSVESVMNGEKKIDYAYYLENQLFGQLARLINGEKQFESGSDKDSQELAKKYLKKRIKVSDREVGKDIGKKFKPILEEAVTHFKILPEFVKILASEDFDKSSCYKRIKDCLSVTSSSREFVTKALEERGIRPDGFNIDSPKSNSKLKDLKDLLASFNKVGVVSEFNTYDSKAKTMIDEFVEEYYDILIVSIQDFQDCVKVIYESEYDIGFENFASFEYDFSALGQLNSELLKIYDLYKKKQQIIKLKTIVPSLYVSTVSGTFNPKSASQVLAEIMRDSKKK